MFTDYANYQSKKDAGVWTAVKSEGNYYVSKQKYNTESGLQEANELEQINVSSITTRRDILQAELDAINGILTDCDLLNGGSPVVPPNRVISKYAFMSRFSSANYNAILTAKTTDKDVEWLYTLLLAADDVNLDEASAFLDVLILKGLITAEDKARMIA